MCEVILISGKAQHGKDTFAGFLKENYEKIGKKVLILHFADYLKFICKQYFEWDGNKDQKGRELLQHIGTDIVRTRNENFWVDIIVSLVRVLECDYDFFIIPDTRFLSEIRQFKNWGMELKVIRIERPNHMSLLTEEQKNHKSEVELDDYNFDKIILNDGSLEDLEMKSLLYIENKF